MTNTIGMRGYQVLLVLESLPNEDRYGAQVARIISERLNETVHSGTVYAALHSLEWRRYVFSYGQHPKGRGTSHRVYVLTNRGKRWLRNQNVKMLDMIDRLKGLPIKKTSIRIKKGAA